MLEVSKKIVIQSLQLGFYVISLTFSTNLTPKIQNICNFESEKQVSISEFKRLIYIFQEHNV